METTCPYCGEDIWFENDEWEDMMEGPNGCVIGHCPECEADCCYTCQHVYSVGTGSDIRMSQIRQQERPLQNPNYPF